MKVFEIVVETPYNRTVYTVGEKEKNFLLNVLRDYVVEVAEIVIDYSSNSSTIRGNESKEPTQS